MRAAALALLVGWISCGCAGLRSFGEALAREDCARLYDESGTYRGRVCR